MLDIGPPPIWMPSRPAIVGRASELVSPLAGVLSSPIFESPIFGGKAAGIGGNDSYTTFLCHMDGADASTTFTDVSASAHTISATNNAQVDTAQSVFGGASLLCGSSDPSDLIRTPINTSLQFGTGDFAIDWRAKHDSDALTNGGETYFQLGVLGAGLTMWQYTNNTNVRINYNGTEVDISHTPGTSWHWYMLRRSGTTLSFHADGSSLWSTTSSANFSPSTSYYLNIGGMGDRTYWGFRGWIDEFRVSKGDARDPATVPTQAYS